MTDEKMIQYAEEEGFVHAAMVNTEDIVFDPSFRVYCGENICGQYGANYSCPPDCGSPEEMKRRILSHKRALVLQTVWEIPDFSDSTSIQFAKKEHNAYENRLIKRLRAEDCHGFVIGASGCALCKPCKQVFGQPCQFPDLKYSCMSAYCIFVKKLADTCGMEYNWGEGQVAFFGMFVLD